MSARSPASDGRRRRAGCVRTAPCSTPAASGRDSTRNTGSGAASPRTIGRGRWTWLRCPTSRFVAAAPALAPSFGASASGADRAARPRTVVPSPLIRRMRMRSRLILLRSPRRWSMSHDRLPRPAATPTSPGRGSAAEPGRYRWNCGAPREWWRRPSAPSTGSTWSSSRDGGWYPGVATPPTANGTASSSRWWTSRRRPGGRRPGTRLRPVQRRVLRPARRRSCGRRSVAAPFPSCTCATLHTRIP